MAATAGVPVLNMLLYVVIALIPTAVCGAFLWLPRLFRRFQRRPKPAPAGPPIEKLAADLRRVRRILVTYESGTPVVRRLGTLQAYDHLLVQACRAVRVPQRIDQLSPGIDLELERLRVEESLRDAGVAIT
ncbi:hypothetical protein [Actinocrispum sp. NPDC049592]|uniref:hypothetical protein n=1 Tax=Actinocrispum sp. NPDC049592 TaxID=3154835 RepID=UPI003445F304